MPELPPGGLAWESTLRLKAADGVGLRGAVWRPDGSRGHVLLLTGRTEFLEKAALPAAELAARGFAVASLDWRGQGLSDRLAEPAAKGHVEAFTDYHMDLAALLAAPEVARLPGPRIVLAHSMGGLVALGALKRNRLPADALVLSAPLLDVQLARMMRLAAGATVLAAALFGRLDRWPPFGNNAAPYVLNGFEGNVLTGDRAVWDWMAEVVEAEPRLAIGMPTIGWINEVMIETRKVRHTGTLSLPALILLGTAETVVDPNEIRRAAPRLGAELAEIEGGRHEVLVESPPLRAEAWSAIDGFLERHGF